MQKSNWRLQIQAKVWFTVNELVNLCNYALTLGKVIRWLASDSDLQEHKLQVHSASDFPTFALLIHISIFD